MPSTHYDLNYLREALDSLETYLLSPDIFWNLTAKPPPGEPLYPALTLGGFLLAYRRLQGRQLQPADDAVLQKISIEVDRIRLRWRTAWEKKAASSYQARITQWRNFLEDYRSNPEGNVDRYPYEVRLRVMLELLDQSNPYIPPEQRQFLSSLDSLLSAYLVPGSFIWEEECKVSFPEDQYGYLYGRLKIPKNGSELA
jgi:hypothetical protein